MISEFDLYNSSNNDLAKMSDWITVPHTDTCGSCGTGFLECERCIAERAIVELSDRLIVDDIVLHKDRNPWVELREKCLVELEKDEEQEEKIMINEFDLYNSSNNDLAKMSDGITVPHSKLCEPRTGFLRCERCIAERAIVELSDRLIEGGGSYR
ncbi:hypothetical protein DRH14_04440 [Candidatus Shapirobacteria bacterium]|nr:MAG: hypothetical protein DRH14_04440 [Candidatus Shapirobacteria bacterium]